MTILSQPEREARKRAHEARLAAKSSPDYPMLYAQQPDQQEKAIANRAAAEERRAAKAALVSKDTANYDAAASMFSGAISTKKGGAK